MFMRMTERHKRASGVIGFCLKKMTRWKRTPTITTTTGKRTLTMTTLTDPLGLLDIDDSLRLESVRLYLRLH